MRVKREHYKQKNNISKYCDIDCYNFMVTH